MRIEDIEVDLKRRVDETRDWLKGEAAPVIYELDARGTPGMATAIELINDPGRKESDGARFRLEYGPEGRRYESLIEVRIKSTSSEQRDGGGISNGPYVAVYVLEIGSGTGLLSYFDQFDNPEVYFNSVDVDISDWYSQWLQRLLRQRTGNIIFKHKRPM